jgi:hypothetical protein
MVQRTLTLSLAVFQPPGLRPVERATTSATMPHRSKNWRALCASSYSQTRTNHNKIVESGC